jgi:prepilin-type N-terminal cleavage/methylation domain-containing protein
MKRIFKQPPQSSQQGFTILELMIATTVLAVILLLVTVMITGIGNLYYKGVTQSQTQDVTRTLMSSIVQDIQLNKGIPSLGVPLDVTVNGTHYSINSACEGTARYSYIVGPKIGSDAGDILHVMWRNTVTSGAPCDPMNLTKDLSNSTSPDYDASGSELLGQKMRLTSSPTFVHSTVNVNLFTITISVAYGDDELLNLGAGYDTTCKGAAADQFCATDRLTSGAVQRIN